MFKKLLAALLHPLRFALRAVLALIILFEEWGWAPLQRLMAALGRLPVLRQLEAGIRRLPPYAALCLLAVPALALLPVKLAALWLVAKGRTVLGIGLIVLAKLVGTALVARLFALIRPALMQLAWFERLYGRWTAWKQHLLDWVRASALWRSMRAVKLGLRRRWRRSFAARG